MPQRFFESAAGIRRTRGMNALNARQMNSDGLQTNSERSAFRPHKTALQPSARRFHDESANENPKAEERTMPNGSRTMQRSEVGLAEQEKRTRTERADTKKGEQDFHLLSSFPSGTNWNRTSDTRIFSPLLYQLSYRAILFKRPTFGSSTNPLPAKEGAKIVQFS